MGRSRLLAQAPDKDRTELMSEIKLQAWVLELLADAHVHPTLALAADRT